MTRTLRISLAMVLFVVCTACGNKAGPTTQRPSSTAKLAIVTPQPGALVSGKTFTVKLRLTGGRITSVVSTHLTPDEGHVHISIDGAIQTMTFGLTQTLKTPSKGSHLLQAQFVAKDHGPFSPQVTAAANFTVK